VVFAPSLPPSLPPSSFCSNLLLFVVLAPTLTLPPSPSLRPSLSLLPFVVLAPMLTLPPFPSLRPSLKSLPPHLHRRGWL
jgi:hypothetical protein